ncbi:MAG: hypothetical protein ACP5I8_09530, partial [Phycisphaerae bacterium]
HLFGKLRDLLLQRCNGGITLGQLRTRSETGTRLVNGMGDGFNCYWMVSGAAAKWAVFGCRSKCCGRKR